MQARHVAMEFRHQSAHLEVSPMTRNLNIRIAFTSEAQKIKDARGVIWPDGASFPSEVVPDPGDSIAFGGEDGPVAFPIKLRQFDISGSPVVITLLLET